MTDKLHEFIDAMHSHGIGPVDASKIVADDKRHRYQVEGDANRTLNGEYQLRIDADGFAVGWFKSYKTLPDAVSWHSRSHKKRASAEEKAEWAARVSADKARREAADLAMRERAKEECARVWAAGEDATGIPYLAARGLGEWKARKWVDFDRYEDCLLVPAKRDSVMVGLQKVYPDGGKLFVPGSDLVGAYCEIAGSDQVAVCEGYATAVTIHQATGWTVRAAFNAGNLRNVVTAGCVVCSDEDLYTWHPKHRSEMPDVLPERDSDDWIEWRAKGWLLNTGRDRALEAAGVIGGAQVLYPSEGGDWDDVRQRDGLDAVRDRLLGAVNMVQTPDPEWEPVCDEVGPSWEDMASPTDLLADLTNPLGYDKELYFFLPRTKGQIIELSATALGSINNLYQLGSVYDYQRVLGNSEIKAGEIASTVGPMLIDMCHRKGIYEPEKVFGSGAWRVGGKVYVNTGRAVWDASQRTESAHSEVKIDGVFVKEARAYDLAVQPLGNKDANKLVQICQSLHWKRPINGTLLAGWLVIASVGGALRWRPHVFITGPKGAGKSTVVELIVEPVLGLAELRQDGGSTEAGLRKTIGDSSRPVVMDEFEGENKRDAENVAKILFWARKASSGGVIVNANGAFRAQSCVCFAAINPLVAQGADADRITLLELEVNNADGSEENYDKLLELIYETITPEYSKGLVRRTVDNIDALLKNCEMFAKHASRILGSKRAGDQIGPMLAGAYMLHSTGVVTDEKAAEYCARQDWSWVQDQQDGTDSERLVRKIMNSLIDHNTSDRSVKMPISELIARVYYRSMGWEDAVKTLTRFGLAVKDGWLCVANSDDNLSGLLAGTPWVVYRQGLSRYHGAVSDGKTMRFGTGSPRRYLKIPLDGLIGDAADVEEITDWG